jgi:circadian clock protein KaiC
METRRVKSGVPGLPGGHQSLDDILGGGFPEGSVVVVSGDNGSGKTVMALQYAVHGAMRGERSIYFSFDQRRSDLVGQAACFGWDVERLEAEGNLILQTFNVVSDSLTEIQKEILRQIENYQPKRVAIDSITMYALVMEIVESIGVLVGMGLEHKNVEFSKELLVRLALLKLFGVLKTFNSTTLVASEAAGDNYGMNSDKVAQFLGDGVIRLEPSRGGGDYFGYLQVKEMRRTKHSRGTYEIHMTNEGIMLGAQAEPK